MNSIVEKVRIPIQKIVEENGLILYDLEYLKEEGTFFLRVSIERPDKTMDFDTCSVISEKISDLLDEIDPISHEYILEVCSPGAERPLRNKKDYEDAMNQYIQVNLINLVENKESFKGYLVAMDDNTTTISYKDKTRDKKVILEFSNIASANLAVKI